MQQIILMNTAEAGRVIFKKRGAPGSSDAPMVSLHMEKNRCLGEGWMEGLLRYIRNKS